MFEVKQELRLPHGGLVYYPTLNARRRSRRMRMAAIAVTVAVGVSGGVLHQFYTQTALSARMGSADYPIPEGPFALFPR
jgi:hypothetical protein